ncbi:hypothetical protein EC973_001250 [Apophysomyces ossiformis]|uniref:Uncharacterized protein n=1 Tax=Apophysomyces ossiformis TaxID=679940 RepID=A0A8H7BKJ3_9FUNG|nr:hypothetical protein EC973_001250 [Apophysomyces ossiformis]
MFSIGGAEGQHLKCSFLTRQMGFTEDPVRSAASSNQTQHSFSCPKKLMALPFVSNETSNWLLYILTDSALPTGGFVASSGLEASFQAGLLSPAKLPAFVTSSTHAYASTTSCFVRAGYEALDQDDPIAMLLGTDGQCNAVQVTNAVAHRASVAQGVAMLTLYLKCFAKVSSTENNTYTSIVQRWKNLIRSEQTEGHFPVCFGLVCRALGVDLGKLYFI